MTVFLKILDLKAKQHLNKTRDKSITLSKNEIIHLSLYLFKYQHALVNNMSYKDIKKAIIEQKIDLFGITVQTINA